MTHSLRVRLLMGSLIATLVVFVVAAAVLYWLLRVAWLREFDAAMEARAHALIALVEYDSAGLKMDLEKGQMPEFDESSHTGYFLITDGQRTLKSPSLGNANWLIDANAVDQSPALTFVNLPSGRNGRLVQLAFVPRADDGVSPEPRSALIRVARDSTELSDRLLQLGWGIGAVFALAMVMSASAMAWVVGRGLRPLAVLADRIHAIGTTNLSEQVSLEQSPTEMRVVVRRLNELLAKVEAGLRREREFTADVAHELRTPLAGLTTAMQVCLSQPRASGEYEAVLSNCLRACGGMRGMVENLLTLARAEAQQVQPVREATDVPALLREQWRAFEKRAGERRLNVEWWMPDGLVIHTDSGLLSSVVRNLFDNAMTYCDTGGTVRIETQAQGCAAILRISNTGSQVADGDGFHVFERFWRGDAARSVSGHCGLGLAMCERIIRLLGGIITVQTALGGSFVIGVQLPADVPTW